MDVLEIETKFNNYSKSLFDSHDKMLELNVLKVRTDIAYLEVYYIFLNFVVDEGLLNHQHRAEQILYAKISTDILGILSNLSVGCISQAMIILRSLFETTIYSKFIGEKPDIRLDLYADFSIVQKHSLNKKDKRIDENVKKQFELIKHKYHIHEQTFLEETLNRPHFECDFIFSFMIHEFLQEIQN